jgi:hypothetical protein
MAVLPLAVHGADIDGLVITADPGGLMSGRLITDTAEKVPSSERPGP